MKSDESTTKWTNKLLVAIVKCFLFVDIASQKRQTNLMPRITVLEQFQKQFILFSLFSNEELYNISEMLIFTITAKKQQHKHGKHFVQQIIQEDGRFLLRKTAAQTRRTSSLLNVSSKIREKSSSVEWQIVVVVTRE